VEQGPWDGLIFYLGREHKGRLCGLTAEVKLSLIITSSRSTVLREMGAGYG
jgi:hypothetical protein